MEWSWFLRFGWREFDLLGRMSSKIGILFQPSFRSWPLLGFTQLGFGEQCWSCLRFVAAKDSKIDDFNILFVSQFLGLEWIGLRLIHLLGLFLLSFQKVFLMDLLDFLLLVQLELGIFDLGHKIWKDQFDLWALRGVPWVRLEIFNGQSLHIEVFPEAILKDGLGFVIVGQSFLLYRLIFRVSLLRLGLLEGIRAAHVEIDISYEKVDFC